MAETLYAVFADPSRAESAAGALLDHGVLPSEISLILSEQYRKRRGTADDPELAYTLPTVVSGSTGRVERTDPMGNELRNAGEVPVMSGEVGPRSQVSIPPQDEPRRDLPKPAPDERRITGHDEGQDFPGHVEQDELGVPEYDPERAAKHGVTMTTPQDAALGAVKGAEIGLGVGVLAAIAAITVPGFGLVVGGGAIAAAIAGLAATTGAGAVAGGLFGFLRDQGVPAHAIKAYSEVHGEGGAILTVQLSTKVPREEIEDLLQKYGAGCLVSYGGYVA